MKIEDNKEIKHLIENFEDIPTSDLQGAVEVIAKKYNLDVDDVLDYIYEKVWEKEEREGKKWKDRN